MIHALRRPDTDTLRRGLGLLLVVVIVIVVLAGAAHALEADHDHVDAHGCGVCVALAVLSASLPPLLIVLLWRLYALRTLASPRTQVSVRRRARGPSPARGPPVRL